MLLATRLRLSVGLICPNAVLPSTPPAGRQRRPLRLGPRAVSDRRRSATHTAARLRLPAAEETGRQPAIRGGSLAEAERSRCKALDIVSDANCTSIQSAPSSRAPERQLLTPAGWMANNAKATYSCFHERSMEQPRRRARRNSTLRASLLAGVPGPSNGERRPCRSPAPWAAPGFAAGDGGFAIKISPSPSTQLPRAKPAERLTADFSDRWSSSGASLAGVASWPLWRN